VYRGKGSKRKMWKERKENRLMIKGMSGMGGENIYERDKRKA
jgi:hypothetical protein